ncbi:hypothetical protein Tco_1547844 [Tanacetum coccineum]
MCSYLKNMEGWKPKDLKSKSFANIQELFNKAMKRANTFVDYKTELVEGSSKKSDAEIAQESSSKRVGDELEQESIKKQKMDEDKETIELKSLMEVIPNEKEVAVDDIPLATEPPSIVDWKIHKKGKKSYYQIIRADGCSKIALGGVGNEKVVVREGVVVTSSSLEMLTNSCLGGIMVSLIFLEGLEEEEALVEFMVELCEEDEDGRKNEKDGLFNLKGSDQSRKA